MGLITAACTGHTLKTKQAGENQNTERTEPGPTGRRRTPASKQQSCGSGTGRNTLA